MTSTTPEFTVTCGLRFSDFDMLGHLNQRIYHVVLEQARTAWLGDVRAGQDWRAETFVLARIELDFRREVDSSHREVIATCRPEHVGNSSVICAQQVRFADGTVAAEGKSVLVGFDLTTRAKRTFSEQERAALLG